MSVKREEGMKSMRIFLESYDPNHRENGMDVGKLEEGIIHPHNWKETKRTGSC